MARINIEDSVFKDNRFIDLCIKSGSRDIALGRLVAMWIVAQKFYLTHGEIPARVWIEQGLSDVLIECGMAERTSTGVRARGQDEQFAWLRSSQRSGLASAAKRRKMHGNAIPKNASNRRTSVRKKSERPSTDAEPTSTSSSSSFSSSFSFSSSPSLFVPPGSQATTDGAAGDDGKLLCRRIWEAYQAAYRNRYGTDPVRNATVNSQIASLAKRLGEEALEVVAFYLAHNKGFYLEKCHPIGLCLADAESLRTQWARGRAITKTEASQADRLQASSNAWDYAAKAIEEMNRGK